MPTNLPMQNIQSIDVPLLLSVDGVTYNQLVCLSEQTLPLTSQTTETNTQCGVAIGLGPVKFAPTFTAVANVLKDAGTVGLDDMEAYLIAQTALYYKLVRPYAGSVGGVSTLSGRCYVTAITETLTIDDVVKFSGTLSGIGSPVKS